MNGVGVELAGKTANEPNPTVPQIFGRVDMGLIMLPGKTSKVRTKAPVPQSDTGSQGENPEVLE